jgi:hypothetical protein
VTVYGVALLVDVTYPKWLGGLALMGGMSTTVAGVVMAHTGFSGLAMVISMPASSLVLGGCSPLECSCGVEVEPHQMKRRANTARHRSASRPTAGVLCCGTSDVL